MKRVTKKAILAEVRKKGSVAITVREGEVVLCSLKWLTDLVYKASKNKNQLAMLFIPGAK